MAAYGSDCGIANVNLVTSGAESAALSAAESDQVRPRVGLRLVEGLHAQRHQHRQLLLRAAPLAQGVHFV